MKRNNKKAFTIVELVIVIAVIAILASVLIPTFSGVIENAKYSSAFQTATNEFKQDIINNASYNEERVPDGTLYEANGYYFKVSDNALVHITKEEYEVLSVPQIKNIIFIIPDGAGFGTYDIANAYKKRYSASAVNGIVDGIKDDANNMQLTKITTNAIEGKTVTGLYFDEYMIASANTDMFHKYGHDSKGVTDSAAAGTALLCGQKTDYVMAGVKYDFTPLANILELCRLEGKATGAVSTKSLIDATTTDMVAHSIRRPDQGDANKNNRSAYQQDAAYQIINSGIDVQLMYGTDGGYIHSTNGNNLTNGLTAASNGYTIVTDKQSLNNAVSSGVKKVFSKIQIDFSAKSTEAGYHIASDNYSMPYNYDIQGQHIFYDIDARENDLTISDLAKSALTVLSENINDPDGFCLVIEGGAIDNAMENRYIKEGAAEYLALDEVFGYCVNWAMKRKDTIVISCPDHDSGAITDPSNNSTAYNTIDKIVTALHDGTMPDKTQIAGTNSHSSQNVPVCLYAPEKIRGSILEYLGLPANSSASMIRNGLYYSTDNNYFNQDYIIQNSDIAPAIVKAAGLMTFEQATNELFVPIYDDNNQSLYNYGTYNKITGEFTFNNGAKVTKNLSEYVDRNCVTKKIECGLPIYITNPVSYKYEDGSNKIVEQGKATAIFYIPKSVFDDCI